MRKPNARRRSVDPMCKEEAKSLNRDKMHREKELSTHLTYAKMSNNIAKKTTKPQ